MDSECSLRDPHLGGQLPPQPMRFLLHSCDCLSATPFKVWIRRMTSPLFPSPDLSQAAESVNQAEVSCSIPQQLDGQAWALFCRDLEELGVNL